MNTKSLNTKKNQLLEWCKTKGIFSKADVMSYGLNNYYLRADRTIRQFVEKGILEKIGVIEKMTLNLKGNMGYYRWRE